MWDRFAEETGARWQVYRLSADDTDDSVVRHASFWILKSVTFMDYFYLLSADATYEFNTIFPNKNTKEKWQRW